MCRFVENKIFNPCYNKAVTLQNVEKVKGSEYFPKGLCDVVHFSLMVGIVFTWLLCRSGVVEHVLYCHIGLWLQSLFQICGTLDLIGSAISNFCLLFTKLDEFDVGPIPLKDVTFAHLNDNIKEPFLAKMEYSTLSVGIRCCHSALWIGNTYCPMLVFVKLQY